jgi:hypothetical protein
VTRCTVRSDERNSAASPDTISASSPYSHRCLMMNGKCPGDANSVDWPKIEMTTEYATTLASTAGINASDSKSSRYSTSTASNAAPSGVRNTAAMPAATPETIRMRRSAGDTRSSQPHVDPSAPPI